MAAAPENPIIRRVGGLEILPCFDILVQGIIRRVGGLENETPLPQLAPLIIRRVGGLEIIKPFCFHTEGVNSPKP